MQYGVVLSVGLCRVCMLHLTVLRSVVLLLSSAVLCQVALYSLIVLCNVSLSRAVLGSVVLF